MAEKKRYAQVGLGGRSRMYTESIQEKHADKAVLVGFCDINEGRLELARKRAKEEAGLDVPVYYSDDFDRMVEETKPDAVIVTTKDSFHDTYIVRAMELGCDAITEKPMTIDAQRCRKILETKKKTGRNCTVTFNYRYSPPRTQVKDLLMSGVIGEVLSVEFSWVLNVRHGADYYRRWHRNKENSGGLMVHKATHHFDLVNWWLGTVPETVQASGHRRFYVPETAERYGLTKRTERCHDCPEAERCRFRLNMKGNEGLRTMYLDCEEHDGYFRDRCVFSGDIDIEDSMNLVVTYANGAKMAYALNSFSPWEGYFICFSGTKGRLEHKCQETVYISGDGSVPGELKKEGTWTRIYPHWKPAYGVEIARAEGGHGGADPVMLDYIFDPDGQPEDKYLRAADQRSGAYSILVGAAANISMAEGRMVRIDELVRDIGMPDYPPMPGTNEPLPMPAEEK